MQMDPQVDPAGAASVKVEPAVEPQVTELRPDQTATAEPQLLQVESPQLEPAGPAPQVEPAPEPQTQAEPVGPLDANVAIQNATACAHRYCQILFALGSCVTFEGMEWS